MSGQRAGPPRTRPVPLVAARAPRVHRARGRTTQTGGPRRGAVPDACHGQPDTRHALAAPRSPPDSAGAGRPSSIGRGKPAGNSRSYNSVVRTTCSGRMQTQEVREAIWHLSRFLATPPGAPHRIRYTVAWTSCSSKRHNWGAQLSVFVPFLPSSCLENEGCLLREGPRATERALKNDPTMVSSFTRTTTRSCYVSRWLKPPN